ncbi:MAG TPA: GNAT family N-acetyltransferase [Bdellovibrionota bacterium]|nr:GNAT family N-acetyltransferase [Bdellovibrionota bacterium]
MALEVEIIKSASRLEAFGPEWFEVWKEQPETTPFQSPEWLLPWWKYFGSGPLVSMAFRDRGALVGFAPLFIFFDSASKRRKVVLIGTGNTDYLDILASEPYRETVVKKLLAELSGPELRDEWDLCDFQQLRASSPLLHGQADPATSRASMTFSLSTQEICPVMVLKPGAPVNTDLPSGKLKELAKAQRRLESRGTVRFALADWSNFDEIHAALIRHHDARWYRRGVGDAEFSNKARAFLKEAVERLLSRGFVRLHALYFDEIIIAGVLCFVHRDKAYYYMTGFDAEFSRFGVGNVILSRSIMSCIDEGVREIDFLRGREPYKYQWSPEERLNRRLEIRKVPSRYH